MASRIRTDLKSMSDGQPIDTEPFLELVLQTVAGLMLDEWSLFSIVLHEETHGMNDSEIENVSAGLIESREMLDQFLKYRPLLIGELLSTFACGDRRVTTACFQGISSSLKPLLATKEFCLLDGHISPTHFSHAWQNILALLQSRSAPILSEHLANAVPHLKKMLRGQVPQPSFLTATGSAADQNIASGSPASGSAANPIMFYGATEKTFEDKLKTGLSASYVSVTDLRASWLVSPADGEDEIEQLSLPQLRSFMHFVETELWRLTQVGGQVGKTSKNFKGDVGVGKVFIDKSRGSKDIFAKPPCPELALYFVGPVTNVASVGAVRVGTAFGHSLYVTGVGYNNSDQECYFYPTHTANAVGTQLSSFYVGQHPISVVHVHHQRMLVHMIDTREWTPSIHDILDAWGSSNNAWETSYKAHSPECVYVLTPQLDAICAVIHRWPRGHCWMVARDVIHELRPVAAATGSCYVSMVCHPWRQPLSFSRARVQTSKTDPSRSACQRGRFQSMQPQHRRRSSKPLA